MELEDVNSVAVLGAGSMGHGIAEVAALAGYDVTMRDINEDLVQEGYDDIEWSLGKLAENERISEAEADAALERVTPVVDVEEAVADADVVVEAVPEDMEVKKEVYGEVEAHAPDRAIFATNTSSLSITELSEATDRPEQFCGMHFFNPPVRMQLVEVISGAHTAEGTLDLAEGLAESFDKTPVRVRKDSPGFVVNRVLVPLMNESAWLVHDGVATVAEVDSTTKYDLGLPMGSFELADLTGIDVGYHVLQYMHGELGDAYEPCPLLVEKVESDELGRKTGEGFYDYDDGGVEIPADAGSDVVADRLLAGMANEVAKLVGGDVADVETVDEAVMLGAGFPEGPARMADEAGLDHLVAVLEDASEETGHPRYEPSEHLREVAEEGGFYAASAGASGGAGGEAAGEGGGAGGETTGEGGGAGDDLDFQTVRVERPAEGVAQVVLDRPHRMNTVSPQLMADLEDAVDALAEDDETRALLLTGAGDRAFSAGADVQATAAGDPIETSELSRRGQEVFGKLERCPVPVVVGVDGYCLGGGMEMAACADMRIASERSEFGQPEHDIGLIPGWGGTQRLPHIVGEGRAREIIFTADRFDAGTMADYGFVNEVVGNDELEDAAVELAADLAAGPPIAQKLTKRVMLAGRDDTEAGLEAESLAFGHLMNTDDLMEGITAFMEDREPEFEGE